MDTEENLKELTIKRDKEWAQVSKFLVVRRFLKPLEFDGLVAVVKEIIGDFSTRTSQLQVGLLPMTPLTRHLRLG